MRYDLEIENDHFQLLVGDRVRGPLVDTMELWKEGQEVVSRSRAQELVAIGTARFGGKVRVQVEIAPSEPGRRADWKVLGDFVLDVQSGELLLWAPESHDLNRTPTVPIDPGRYAGRAFSRCTDAVTDEMAHEGPDEYRLVVWRVA